ncbi:unnamed protein product [Bursaphelenchus xylophilus]|uniref:(pine wood nematode) hypothetical protein n=1 Tax=Bursaphelenchus xylophilus TaxID=6326 RepID=A0A1I7RPY2_BURXY|nr:unnamed protein product [Bursaphelenchus xylophilus]CAG9096815.1 unnamed protein product [Bursaphelenchus xylophilus]
MNPLDAHVYLLDNCCYRRNAPVERLHGQDEPEVKINEVDTDSSDLEEDVNVEAFDEDDPNLTVDAQEGERISYDSKKKSWMASARVPDMLMGRFIGNQASNKKKMEESTQCVIQIPAKKSNLPVVIYSVAGKECVESCLDQIDLFLSSQREKTNPSHFVSLPLNVEPILSNYEKFKAQVAECKDAKIDPGLFVAKTKLHLTLGLMTLYDDNEVERVGKALDEVVRTKIRPLLKNKPLKVSIKGISHFGDEEGTETRVLFAKPIAEGLEEISELIYQALLETDLGKTQKREFRILHMTLAKIGYKGDVFDATPILSKLRNFDFGTVEISELRICLMHEVESKTGTYPISYVSSLL